jgi:hypothetical protein
MTLSGTLSERDGQSRQFYHLELFEALGKLAYEGPNLLFGNLEPGARDLYEIIKGCGLSFFDLLP